MAQFSVKITCLTGSVLGENQHRHLSEWRGLARKGELVVPIDVAPAFVPLVIEPLADAAGSTDTGVIRVEICGAVLHVAPDCSPERAAAVVAALRKVL